MTTPSPHQPTATDPVDARLEQALYNIIEPLLPWPVKDLARTALRRKITTLLEALVPFIQAHREDR